MSFHKREQNEDTSLDDIKFLGTSIALKENSNKSDDNAFLPIWKQEVNRFKFLEKLIDGNYTRREMKKVVKGFMGLLKGVFKRDISIQSGVKKVISMLKFKIVKVNGYILQGLSRKNIDQAEVIEQIK